ncbi:MAG TPA: hypothetical protein VJR89_18325, partial [Polyangiales bacterium]|nr:hypothetical protein [Polyangiales bacterium]
MARLLLSSASMRGSFRFVLEISLLTASVACHEAMQRMPGEAGAASNFDAGSGELRPITLQFKAVVGDQPFDCWTE